ncbi:AMP-binding protein [Roseobacter sp.]|uniref:AMP-binding protein n=1 Tax=Roseobacter sp. TaxID=1907202 RepID=UPI0032988DCD
MAEPQKISKGAAPSPAAPFRGLAAMLVARAGVDGGATAYQFMSPTSPACAWTWQEVFARAVGVRAEILAMGLRPKDRVLLMFPAGLDFVAAMLGCFCAEVVAVPVSAPRRNDNARWLGIYRDAGARAILVAPCIQSQVRRVAQSENLGPCEALVSADPTQSVLPSSGGFVPPRIAPDDIAFLQYTSGSTGAPKGVVVTHAMVSANLGQIVEGFGYRPDDHLLSWLPMYHDMGLISSVLLPIYTRMQTTLVAPAAFLRDPMWFLGLVGQIGATVLGGPNFAFDQMARRATPETLDLSSVRVVFSGAEAIRPDTTQRFLDAFVPCGLKASAFVGCYGMAESTVGVCVSPPDAPQIDLQEAAFNAGLFVPGPGRRVVSSGVPLRGTQVAIVDPQTGARMPTSHVGEIWVKGAQVSPGYWNRPDANVDVFDQSLEGHAGWLRSGDLGALHDGHLFVTGRIKEMIVIRGANHFPHDIEATVAAAHPQVQPGRVAAYMHHDAAGEGVGLACEVTRAAYRAPDINAMVQAINAALSETHGLAPRRIRFLRPTSLPITPSGKIQRTICAQDLPGVVADRGPQPVHIAAPSEPRGHVARALASAPRPVRRSRLLTHICDQLANATGAQTKVDPQVGFFELGVDSAGSLTLVAALEHALDVPLDATVIYAHPTPASLCDHVMALLSGPMPAPENLPTDDVAALRALLGTPVNS